MPYYFERLKIKLPEDCDRRRKLPKEYHEAIRRRHKEGEAIRALARAYGVDKRLIQFIVYPERLEHSRETAREWRKRNGNTRQRYGKNKWRETIKEHRHYKQSVFKKQK